MELIIMSLRYILLIVLYLFIFRVILLIIKDMRASGQKSAQKQPGNAVINGNTEAYLVVVQSDVPALAEGTKIKLNEENYIGRGPENRIQILDNYTSQKHSRLTLNKGQFWIEDLGSKNGTFVDGVRIEKPVTLINGDLFKVGGVSFKFERWNG